MKSVVLISCVAMLTACKNDDPTAIIPYNERTIIMAQERHDAYLNSKKQAVNIDEMLQSYTTTEQENNNKQSLATIASSKQDAQSNHSSHQVVTNTKTEQTSKQQKQLSLQYEQQNIHLTAEQRAKINQLLASLKNTEQLSVLLQIGPSDPENGIQSASIGQQRAQDLSWLLKQRLTDVQTRYQPDLASNSALVTIKQTA